MSLTFVLSQQYPDLFVQACLLSKQNLKIIVQLLMLQRKYVTQSAKRGLIAFPNSHV